MDAAVISEKKKPLSVKVYVVLCPDRATTAATGDPIVTLLGVKLTMEAAQKIVDRTPGAYVRKAFADKL